jgi:hypothetical protein
MAFNGSCVIEVQTGGDDTNNGGIFDFSTTNKSTNLTATSATGTAPVVSSASYSFVAGDVGAWLYIASGTNWRKGLYQISSVSSGSATINAAAGSYYLADTLGPYAVSTADGCATTASPTGGTWSVDYTQQASAQLSYTDLVQASTTTLTSAAKPFSVNLVGNTISITSGTGTWTTQRVLITNVSGTTATVDKTLGGTGGTGGTGRLGGALASPGKAAGLTVSGMDVFVKSGTYLITSASANVSGGKIYDSAGGGGTNAGFWCGYSTSRVFGNEDTAPLLQVSGAISSFNMVELVQQYSRWWNFELDGASKSSMTGLYLNAGWQWAGRIYVHHTTNYGIISSSGTLYLCRTSNCSGNAAMYSGGVAVSCESYSNTISGISAAASGTQFLSCLSYANTGASSDGFADANGNLPYTAINCVAYGNGRAGFNLDSGYAYTMVNCIAEGNTGIGFRTGSTRDAVTLRHCAGYNNSSNYDSTQLRYVHEFKAGTTSFFTNAASGDFSLNNTAGGGALLRQAGEMGASPRGTSTGYESIGAFEPAAAGGTAGARLVGPSALVSA